MTRSWLLRALFRLWCGVLVLACAYGGAALVGSLWPANPGWKQAKAGVTVYVVTNGYHSGILLPASADGIDLTLTYRPTDLPDPDDAGNFLLFGWGDRDFYLNTPTWDKLDPATAFVAFWGSGETLLHVDHLKSPEEVSDRRPIRLSRTEYRQLAAAVRATVRPGTDGYPVPVPGYGRLDVFYGAKGRYSALNTCNVWTADMLAEAGVKVGRWTPFSGGVMWWFSPSPARPG